MIYLFGRWELDDTSYELRCGGVGQRLSPRTYDVLSYLLRNNDRVVSTRELMEAVWEGVAVSTSVVPVQIGLVRRALGPAGVGHRVIQTDRGQGYRMTIPVERRLTAARSAQPELGMMAHGGSAPARRRVREWLAQDLQRVLSGGSGRVVLLAGDQGIGKTHILHELAAQARTAGAPVLEGRASAGSPGAQGPPPLWPWIQVLRGAVVCLGLRRVRALLRPHAAALVPWIAGDGAYPTDADAALVPEPRIPPESGSSWAGARGEFELREAVCRVLWVLARQRASVLLIDELERADEASLALLRFVARELRSSRLLFVGAYRDTDSGPGHRLTSTLVQVAREPHTVRLELKGFDEKEVSALLERELGRVPGTGLVRQLLTRTDGNPPLVFEAVEQLRRASSSDAPAGPRMGPPAERARARAHALLAGLSQRCREVLAVAAVIGREFGLHLLRDASDLEEAELLQGLKEASERGVITDEALHRSGRLRVGSYRFRNAGVGEVIYDELSAVERMRIHWRVGRVLECLSGDGASGYGAPPGGAIDDLLAAARQAEDALAHGEAIAHLRRALQATRFSVQDERLEGHILIQLGCAERRAGRLARGRASLVSAVQVASLIGDPLLEAEACLAQASWPRLILPPLVPEDGLGSYAARVTRLLDVLPDDAHAERARLISARILCDPRGDLEERSAQVHQAEVMAQASQSPEARFDAILARFALPITADEMPDAVRASDRLIEAAHQSGDRLRVFNAHEVRIWLRSTLARDDVEDEIVAARRLADELGHPACHYSLVRRELGRALAEGKLHDMKERLAEAQAAGERAEDPQAGRIRQLYGFYVLLRHERRREVRDLVQSRIRCGVQQPISTHEYELAVECALALGFQRAARHGFELLAAEDFVMLSRGSSRPFHLAACAQLAADLGDAARAEQLYTWLRPYEGLHLSTRRRGVCIGAADGPLGELAAMLGRTDEAVARFEAALELNARTRARIPELRVLRRYAALLEGSAGELGRALHLRDRADTLAARLGIRPRRR